MYHFLYTQTHRLQYFAPNVIGTHHNGDFVPIMGYFAPKPGISRSLRSWYLFCYNRKANPLPKHVPKWMGYVRIVLWVSQVGTAPRLQGLVPYHYSRGAGTKTFLVPHPGSVPVLKDFRFRTYASAGTRTTDHPVPRYEVSFL